MQQSNDQNASLYFAERRSCPQLWRGSGFIQELCILLILTLFSALTWAEPRVIGYMPSFKNLKATVDATDLAKLTHINISFLNPDAKGILIAGDEMTCMPGVSGENTSAKEIRYLVGKAQAAGVKVLASVAGGVIPECSGDWAELLKPANRQPLIVNLIKYVDEFNLDGLDIDIEGALLTSIDKAGHYTPFIQALSRELKKRNKLLTCATASYEGGMVPVSSLPYFDFVNLMSYDAIGPSWGTPGIEHSSYEQAVAHIELWKARGLEKEKLVLGVPFYGYGFGDYKSDYAFKDILSQFGAESASLDVIGKRCVGAGCSYITYNGLPTIAAKARLALKEGSGIMIWEMSQDATGSHSLLNAIHQEINPINAD